MESRHNIKGLLLTKSLLSIEPTDGMSVIRRICHFLSFSIVHDLYTSVTLFYVCLLCSADIRAGDLLVSRRPIFSSPDTNLYDLLNVFQKVFSYPHHPVSLLEDS